MWRWQAIELNVFSSDSNLHRFILSKGVVVDLFAFVSDPALVLDLVIFEFQLLANFLLLHL